MYRILKGLATLLILAVASVGAIVVFAWIERAIPVTLPAPTGSFPVGRLVQDWTDETGFDTFAPVPGTKRELLVWMWYPTVARQPAATDDYVPAQLPPIAKEAGARNIWTLLTRDTSKVRGHSASGGAVSPQQAAYPVVIVRAGGSSEVLNYSSLVEDLVSHGYIVVGFDAPYRTGRVVFPDGRVMYRGNNNPEMCVVPDRTAMERCVAPFITAWTGDIAFVLDRLTRLNQSDPSGPFAGRLDMSRVGVLGHSLGGAVAAEFCRQDSRCKAGIDLDGAPHGRVIETGLTQPFMFLLSDHGYATDPESAQIVADIRSIYDRIPPDRRVYATIRGAFHFTFSDDGVVRKSSMLRGALWLLGRLRIDARRQIAVTTFSVQRFFDAFLKGVGGPPASLSSPLYPEIKMGE